MLTGRKTFELFGITKRIRGAGPVGVVTVKTGFCGLIWPATEIVTAPVVAPVGTVVVIVMAVGTETSTFVTVAAVPLNVTMLSAGFAEKPVPVIVTVAPIAPEAGLSDAMFTVEGGGAG